ncbi:MAG: hypothetical protein COU22_02315 [Candidatus Komeilibacteria bacterium CG10_big_fil_rev_8_21_14_0_10_41_13]|uniref:Uncharacterized protein n=1 Tax=Candidatus Komeilibacteria bacterium CG10_big_fil_rev_8_21_14_0_10_41_13 TaxID=1974476 RepID=A0A2M6WC89_9BACT|nr:MAG: hypothetical protein COU22_02315 [Candidatus Komeilibacteria bacterium CG10_big_fil_rev_8_21_14_0_10_41_13]
MPLAICVIVKIPIVRIMAILMAIVEITIDNQSVADQQSMLILKLKPVKNRLAIIKVSSQIGITNHHLDNSKRLKVIIQEIVIMAKPIIFKAIS